MSNVSGAGAGNAMHGHNSIQMRATITSLDLHVGTADQKAKLNAEIQHAAVDAMKSFGAGQGTGAPASSPGAFGSLPGLDMSMWQAKFNEAGEIGSTLDKMESEAMKLLKSPKKEDQIKGQQMMQAMQAIMDAVIKAIQARGEAMKNATQNSTSR